LTAANTAHFFQFKLGFLDLSQNSLCVPVESAPRIGQPYFLDDLLDSRHPSLLFQLPDLHGNSGLGKV